MNVLVLNPNDSIVVADSILLRVNEVADASLLIVRESGTNDNDVTIALIICITIAFIMVAAFFTFCRWKKNARLEKEKERYEKREEVPVSENKQNVELMNKLIDFQKELTSPYYKDKDGNLSKKNYDDKESIIYKKLLYYLLKKKKVLENDTDIIQLFEETKPFDANNTQVDPKPKTENKS